MIPITTHELNPNISVHSVADFIKNLDKIELPFNNIDNIMFFPIPEELIPQTSYRTKEPVSTNNINGIIYVNRKSLNRVFSDTSLISVIPKIHLGVMDDISEIEECDLSPTDKCLYENFIVTYELYSDYNRFIYSMVCKYDSSQNKIYFEVFKGVKVTFDSPFKKIYCLLGGVLDINTNTSKAGLFIPLDAVERYQKAGVTEFTVSISVLRALIVKMNLLAESEKIGIVVEGSYKKGKLYSDVKPPVFETIEVELSLDKIVKLNEQRLNNQPTGIKQREHYRSGHYRYYKRSNKRIWVDSYKAGDPKVGIIEKVIKAKVV